jgi:CheY-like chemotaxis protein
MTTSIRTLIVEDSDDDTKLVLRSLHSGGYDPQWTKVASPEGLTSALGGRAWDVIICDYALPHMNGLGTLKIVAEGGRDIPFILSGLGFSGGIAGQG